MPEPTSNVEFAHKIHEQGHHGGPHGRAEWLEVIEAIVLACVAVLTAWSGYQAARWDARSAASYARASSITADAQEQQTLAGQEHLYDICTFNSWMAAKSRHDDALAGDLRAALPPGVRGGVLRLDQDRSRSQSERSARPVLHARATRTPASRRRTRSWRSPGRSTTPASRAGRPATSTSASPSCSPRCCC